MTRAAEYKDDDTSAHVQRISYYSRELARMLGLDEAFVDKIFFASPMHDIGKMASPTISCSSRAASRGMSGRS